MCTRKVYARAPGSGRPRAAQDTPGKATCRGAPPAALNRGALTTTRPAEANRCEIARRSARRCLIRPSGDGWPEGSSQAWARTGARAGHIRLPHAFRGDREPRLPKLPAWRGSRNGRDGISRDGHAASTAAPPSGRTRSTLTNVSPHRQHLRRPWGPSPASFPPHWDAHRLPRHPRVARPASQGHLPPVRPADPEGP